MLIGRFTPLHTSSHARVRIFLLARGDPVRHAQEGLIRAECASREVAFGKLPLFLASGIGTLTPR
jgi:hypothetical protein